MIVSFIFKTNAHSPWNGCSENFKFHNTDQKWNSVRFNAKPADPIFPALFKTKFIERRIYYNLLKLNDALERVEKFSSNKKKQYPLTKSEGTPGVFFLSLFYSFFLSLVVGNNSSNGRNCSRVLSFCVYRVCVYKHSIGNYSNLLW